MLNLKKNIYSKDFVIDHYFNKNSIIFVSKKYPNIKQFMQNIYKNDVLFYSTTFITNPYSSMFERKLIHY